MIVENVLAWARGAEIGERVVYHRGVGIDTTGVRLGGAGVSARLAHEEGLVFLVQRRVGDTRAFLYEAVRISTPCARALRLIPGRD